MSILGEPFQYASGSAGFYTYQINQSARFDATDSSNLSRTASGGGSST